MTMLRHNDELELSARLPDLLTDLRLREPHDTVDGKHDIAFPQACDLTLATVGNVLDDRAVSKSVGSVGALGDAEHVRVQALAANRVQVAAQLAARSRFVDND